MMAGVGAGEVYIEEYEKQQTPFNPKSNADNTSSFPISREMTTARTHDDHGTVENIQENFNAATGKCVTLQQYKEQGAPKYVVFAT